MKPVQELLIDLIRIPSVSALSNVPVIDYIAATLDPKIWNLCRLSYRDTAGVLKQNLLATMNSIGNQPIELALVETVVFGPGDMRVAHRSGEHVSLAELDRATNILVQIIRQLCG
jgi:acetylornithine deacetylase/succinyl-diaminopimelate desuccinylase-like protein